MAENIERQRETTIRDFLNVVFRRKFLIASIVLGATLMVVFLNLRQGTLYESQARILVKRGERANVFSQNVRYLGWEEEVSSQIEMILSEAVFRKAREILADSAKVWGENFAPRFRGGNVRANVIGESNVYVISYMDPDPVLARRGCEAVTRAFQGYYRQRTSPPSLGDFFAEEIQDLKTQLDYWIKKKNDFLNKNMYLGMAEEGRFLMSKMAILEDKLMNLEGDIAEKNNNVESLRNLVQLPPEKLEDELSFSFSVDYMHSGIISNIRFTLHNLHIRRNELINKYTDKHPKVVAVDDQIAEQRASLKNEITNIYEIEQKRLDELLQMRAKLERELDETKSKLDAIPDKEMESQKIDSRIALLQNKYELILKKQDEAEIAMASAPEMEVTILSSASPAYPKKTKDYIRIALGPLFSFIIALGLAFFFESLDHSLKNVAEVEEFLDLPVLATISEVEMKE